MSSPCGYTFYTIKPYDDRPARASPLPFRDRELTDIEKDERERWWTETKPVTSEGNDDPFFGYLLSAIAKPVGMRSEIERYAVNVFTALKQKVQAMDAAQKQKVVYEHQDNDNRDSGS